MKPWNMRSGVWVESDQGVGVRHYETHGGIEGWWVHLVNSDGTTLTQIPEDRCTNVDIARASSIPATRVSHLTAEQLAALGYI